SSSCVILPVKPALPPQQRHCGPGKADLQSSGPAVRGANGRGRPAAVKGEVLPRSGAGGRSRPRSRTPRLAGRGPPSPEELLIPRDRRCAPCGRGGRLLLREPNLDAPLSECLDVRL